MHFKRGSSEVSLSSRKGWSPFGSRDTPLYICIANDRQPVTKWLVGRG